MTAMPLFEYLFYEAKTLRLKKASKSAARLWHHMRGYEALPCALFRDCGAVHMNEVVFQRRGDFIMSSPEEQLMPSRKSRGEREGEAYCIVLYMDGQKK